MFWLNISTSWVPKNPKIPNSLLTKTKKLYGFRLSLKRNFKLMRVWSEIAWKVFKNTPWQRYGQNQCLNFTLQKIISANKWFSFTRKFAFSATKKQKIYLFKASLLLIKFYLIFSTKPKSPQLSFWLLKDLLNFSTLMIRHIKWLSILQSPINSLTFNLCSPCYKVTSLWHRKKKYFNGLFISLKNIMRKSKRTAKLVKNFHLNKFNSWHKKLKSMILFTSCTTNSRTHSQASSRSLSHYLDSRKVF